MTNKEIVKAWFANIDKNNFDGVKILMDSNHIFHNPMTPEPVGIDQHIGMMQLMTSAFKGEHILELIIEDKDHAVVRGRWKGTHSGEFNGIPATNKPVEFTSLTFLKSLMGRFAKKHLK